MSVQKSKRQGLMADTARCAGVIHLQKSTKRIVKMCKVNKKIEAIRGGIKKGEIVINKGMLFLPDDFKKLKLKGKWVLYIKKGLLIKLDNKRKGKVAIRPSLLKKK